MGEVANSRTQVWAFYLTKLTNGNIIRETAKEWQKA
jgi:hypothetical protein